MLIHSETSLRDFSFWCGGADNAACLSYEQLDIIEDILTDLYPNGIDQVFLNDLFSFDEDTIAEWLGYEDFEALRNEAVPWN